MSIMVARSGVHGSNERETGRQVRDDKPIVRYWASQTLEKITGQDFGEDSIKSYEG
jgi:hypothetical protein